MRVQHLCKYCPLFRDKLVVQPRSGKENFFFNYDVPSVALGKSLVSLPWFLHQWNNYVWIPQAVLRIWQYSLDWIKINALKCQPVLFSQQIKPRDCTRPATLLQPISSESLHSSIHCLVLPQGLPANLELSLSLPLTHNTKKSIFFSSLFKNPSK